MYVDFMKIVGAGGHPYMIPRYPEDTEKVNKLRQNVIYRANIRRPRNAKHHRKLMGMIRFVLKNTERWMSVDQILLSLKYELGLVDLVQGFRNTLREVPRSIAYDEMDEDEFDRVLYKPGVPLLAKEVGMDLYEFEQLFQKYDRE